jgi:hypothetical protein
MSVFKAFSTLLFATLCIQSPVIFFPSQAHAWSCCGCSCRALGCYCPGQGGCIWYPCHTNDSPTLQAETLTNNERFDVTGSYSSTPSPSPTSYSTDRLIARASSDQCYKNDLSRKFFHSAEDRLVFASDLLNYKDDNKNVVELAKQER